MKILKTYQEIQLFKTFEERFNYLKLDGKVGDETFGKDRYLNQKFYASEEWKEIRRFVITRDFGCDLGLLGYDITGVPYIHHMNPITADDIINRTEILTNPDYLITVSLGTHNAIHYGDQNWIDFVNPVIRTPNDTCPWR